MGCAMSLERRAPFHLLDLSILTSVHVCFCTIIYARPSTPVHLLISCLACPLFFPILSFCLALGAFGLVCVSSWTFLTLHHVLLCRWILLDAYLISRPRHILASPSKSPVMLISLGWNGLLLCACKCHFVVEHPELRRSV